MRAHLRRWRRALAVVALLALTVPLAACGLGSGLGAGTAVGAVPAPELHRFYAQQLDWSRCGKFECTYLEVPLDYSQPNGKTARLAVQRRKATQPGQRIGSLVVNPGGPGGSGTALAANLAEGISGTPLGERFDLVGFDPRGVGSSEPAINCRTDRERDDDRLYRAEDHPPTNDAERRAADAKWEQYAKDQVAKCAQRSGVDLLANVGTREVARDMDVLRSALGDAKLTYLGYSYGTRIGYTYAEAFPDNVRALVLDGALDPNRDPADEEVEQEAAFQKAFDTFAEWCAQQAQCPLGGDPKAATANYRKLALPLLDNPLPLSDGRKFAYGDAVTATVHSLYGPQSWETLRKGLVELASGKAEILMAIADEFHGRAEDGEYTAETDARMAIRCVDEKPNTDQAAEVELSKRVIAAAPFSDSGYGPSSALGACAFWPAPPTSVAHQPQVAGLPQVMVISTTGDPATPYQAGVELAKALNARLLTVQGAQHGAAMQGDRCVDDVVTRYFTDLVLPADGANCTLAPPA
ncbi:MAG TPA: alpha/beta hydrolase [Pseudonocardia sp.]|uniref:alpha/beta hydrolase n=1 Tax=Pseudonocardia sp. TaxID=60912 RepID=UPI002BA46EEF|nr:alpha/beta hydrolase [Pseudonocardia sp.]HTF46249.1 alpha/beta hydrolase [Pseudonocardia sp.]